MKLVPTTLGAAVALALAQLAAAQPSVIAPHSRTYNIDQQGAQNSAQVGSGDTGTQTSGSGNQTSATQGNNNQSTLQSGTTDHGTQQSGSDNSAPPRLQRGRYSQN